MTSCKDCLYYEVCPLELAIKGKTGTCLKFKNKADFEEVKHGKWMLARRGRKLVCSCCETHVPFRKDDKRKYHIAWYSSYCPNCGAKMDGERRDT